MTFHGVQTHPHGLVPYKSATYWQFNMKSHFSVSSAQYQWEAKEHWQFTSLIIMSPHRKIFTLIFGPMLLKLLELLTNDFPFSLVEMSIAQWFLFLSHCNLTEAHATRMNIIWASVPLLIQSTDVYLIINS